MAKVTLKLQGLEQAIKKIGKFRLEKIGQVVNELDRTAIAVESGAKRNTPVDTGRLRASIVRQEFGRFNRTVGTNVEYAIHVEFGTRYQRAQPFLYPAAEAERQRFLDNLRRILNTP